VATCIVVIGNSQDILELFDSILKEAGYDVHTFGYQAQALTEIEQLHPDLVIIDTSTSQEGIGWDMMQALKMKTSTASIPIVITTTAMKIVQEIDDQLMNKHVIALHKPFDADDLLFAVNRSLKWTDHVNNNNNHAKLDYSNGKSIGTM
jgi:DNA-binding NtrC family response regulator